MQVALKFPLSRLRGGAVPGISARGWAGPGAGRGGGSWAAVVPPCLVAWGEIAVLLSIRRDTVVSQ